MADLSYPAALAGTLVVEVPVIAVLLPRVAPVTTLRAVSVGVALNLVSHPLLWFVLLPLGEALGVATVVAVTAGEVLVWLLEAGALRVVGRCDGRVALAVAGVANLASLGVGLLAWGLG